MIGKNKNRMVKSSLYEGIIGRECGLRGLRSAVRSSQIFVEKFALATTLKGHRGCVNSVLFSSDGTKILTGSDDTTVNIYNVDNLEQRTTITTQHTNNIFFAQDLPCSDGQKILTCAADGRVILQVLEGSPKCSVLLHKHVGRAHRMSLIPGCGNQFYSCGEDGVICYFDARQIDYSKTNMSSRDSQAVLKTTFYESDLVSNSSIYSMHVNPMKLHELCCAGSEPYVAIYDIRKFTSPVNYWAPPHLLDTRRHITGVRYSYSGEEIIASYSEESIYRFSVNAHCATSLEGHHDAANNADVEETVNGASSKKRRSNHDSSSSRSMDTSTGNETETTPENDENINNNTTHQEDTSAMGAVCDRYLMKYSGHRNIDTVKQVNFYGANSEYVVSGSDCGYVFIWSTETGQLIKLLKADSIGAVNCLSSHPWLPLLATSGLESNAKLWAPIGPHTPMVDGSDQAAARDAIMNRNTRATRRLAAGLRRRLSLFARLIPGLRGGNFTEGELEELESVLNITFSRGIAGVGNDDEMNVDASEEEDSEEGDEDGIEDASTDGTESEDGDTNLDDTSETDDDNEDNSSVDTTHSSDSDSDNPEVIRTGYVVEEPSSDDDSSATASVNALEVLLGSSSDGSSSDKSDTSTGQSSDDDADEEEDANSSTDDSNLIIDELMESSSSEDSSNDDDNDNDNVDIEICAADIEDSNQSDVWETTDEQEDED